MSPSGKTPGKDGSFKRFTPGSSDTGKSSVSFGSEVAESSAPVYRQDQDAMGYLEEIVDAIGANLDRSASVLARIEAKLARA